MYRRVAGTTSNYGTTGPAAMPDTPGGRTATTLVSYTLADIFFLMTIYPALGSQTSKTTPVVNGIGLHYRVNPPLQRVWELNVLCEDGLLHHEGGRISTGAEQTRALLKLAYASTRGGYITMPDGEIVKCQLASYQERMLLDERTNRWRSIVRITVFEADSTGSSGVQALS